MQFAHRGSCDAEAGQQLGHKPATVRLGQPITNRVDGVVKRSRFQHPERSHRHRPICDDRLLAQVGAVVKNAGVVQAGKEFLTRGRKVRVHRVPHLVQRQALHHSGYTQAMITVKVGEAQPRYSACRHPGQ